MDKTLSDKLMTIDVGKLRKSSAQIGYFVLVLAVTTVSIGVALKGSNGAIFMTIGFLMSFFALIFMGLRRRWCQVVEIVQQNKSSKEAGQPQNS